MTYHGCDDYVEDCLFDEAYGDEYVSNAQKKTNEKLEDLRDNLKWIIEYLNYGELNGKFVMQEALLNMCDLLDVNSKELEEKIKFDEVA
jgi:hypothetical protein